MTAFFNMRFAQNFLLINPAFVYGERIIGVIGMLLSRVTPVLYLQGILNLMCNIDRS